MRALATLPAHAFAALRVACLVALFAPVAGFAQTFCDGADAIRVTNDISTNTNWTNDNEYCLDGLIFVNDGATLEIQPGTVVRGVLASNITSGDAASSLIVRRGGRIVADGAPGSPIIFTSELDDLSIADDLTEEDRGLWAGIILLGEATTNQPSTNNQIEGIPFDPDTGEGDEAQYGGQNDNDDSGILRYVSVRHSGFSITGEEGDEIQGITLGGVGNGTTIEYVEIFASADDGIEWFGGTVDVKYAAVAFSFDDAYDYDQGWRGNGQFWLCIAGTDAAGRCGEHDGGDAGGDDAQPFATPVISNATYIGSGQTAPAEGDGNDWAFRMRDGAGGFYYNSIFTDFPDRAIDIENFAGSGAFDSFTQWQESRLRVENNVFFAFGRGPDFADFVDASYSDDNPPPGGDVDDAAFAAYIAGNNENTDPELGGVCRGILNAQNCLDPRSNADATDDEADFDFEELDDDFFTEVDYLGAFAPDEQVWLTGWTALDQMGYLTGSATPNEESAAAATFGFRSVYPNPTAETMTVAFELENAEAATVTVYDVLGREVVVLAEGPQPAGVTTVSLEASRLPAGIYFVRLATDSATATQKVVVVR
jgi:hypothetical protein